MANIDEVLKKIGLTAKQLEEMSDAEAIDTISTGIGKAKDEIASEKDKELLDNAKVKLPKLKEQFEKPFKIYALNVAQSKNATDIFVVGYNPFIKKYIVTRPDQYKNNIVGEEDIITTDKELKANQKKRAGSKKA